MPTPYPLPDYAELRCISNFTFLRGASRPEELVERAKALGYRALAITDECSMAGVVRAHVAAKQAGLSLVLGAQFLVQARHGDEAPFTLVLLACNLHGYGNLCELLTARRLFRRDSDLETFDAVRQCKVPRPSEINQAIPATLESVLLTALARNPDERYASAGAFHAALRDFVLRERMTFRGDQLGEWMRKMFPPRRASP